MSKIKAVFNWSGGKDSALALYKVKTEGVFEIISLLTTVNKEKKRSSMHDIPLQLLQKQAESIGIPLYIVNLPPSGNSEDYNTEMSKAVNHFKSLGATHFIFGDIFLKDVRKYREDLLCPLGITIIEPLWNMTTNEVMEEFLCSGLKTTIVTTDSNLGKDYIGKEITKELINKFPDDIDICGENGEYHTFCHDGPVFRYPVKYKISQPYNIMFQIETDTGEIKNFKYWFAGLDMPE